MSAPLRLRETHAPARSLSVTVPLPGSCSSDPPTLSIIAPTPRAFTFPVEHNLADSPYASPTNSPFEPDLRQLVLEPLQGGGGDEGDFGPSGQPPSPSASDLSSATSQSPSQSQCTETRALSPLLRIPPVSPSSSSSSSPSPRRKTSNGSSSFGDPERRPKKGDDDYVKRPENAFILFRRRCCELRSASSSAIVSASAPPSLAGAPSPKTEPDTASPALPNAPPKMRQAELSKAISAQWKALSPIERAQWEDLAKERKREHERMHPGYVYRPQRSARRTAAANAASAAANAPSTSDGGRVETVKRRKQSAPPPAHSSRNNSNNNVEFMLPAPRSQSFDAHSRSASAPTAPAYQAIQVPNVYLDADPAFSQSQSQYDPAPQALFDPFVYVGNGNGNGFLAPSSGPSLLPLLSTLRIGTGGGFDYMPSVTGGGFNFEANIQSSDFLRSMFPSSSSSVSSVSPAALIAASLKNSSGTATALTASPASPASSTPGSPYTPAEASFHPSMFSLHSQPSADSSSTPAAAASPTGDCGPDTGMGLFDGGLGGGFDGGAGGIFDVPPLSLDELLLDAADYRSYASVWGAQSVWNGAGAQAAWDGAYGEMGLGGAAGMVQADFDIGSIEGGSLGAEGWGAVGMFGEGAMEMDVGAGAGFESMDVGVEGAEV
ncbi:hypothetical protein C8J57DRAFT_1254938 [Mycena rebaudengoi]|nr:hypothetical protein C8J57DRAFT_1254938 [Mycena rebaudengoi]